MTGANAIAEAVSNGVGSKLLVLDRKLYQRVHVPLDCYGEFDGMENYMQEDPSD